MNFEKLSYDPKTGVFIWSKSGHRISIGSIAGGAAPSGHIKITYKGKSYFAHRLAWFMTFGHWPKGCIDHINGNPSDNRISNLRDVDQCINKQNTIQAYSNNKSGLLGASFRPKVGKWRAQIMIDKKVKHLGFFETAEDAHNAYIAAKRENHKGCTI